MREAEVEAISAEIAQLNTVDAHVADAVVAEFTELLLAHSYASRGGVQYAAELLEASLGLEKAHAVMERLNAALANTPFEFLHGADAVQVASFLRDEHPQTTALVLAHLGADHAAKILAALEDPVLQAQVAYRLARMEPAAPDQVRVVEAVLENRFASVAKQATDEGVGGVDALVGMLNRADRSTERRILDALDSRDSEIAEQVRARMFVFEDITELDDKAVQSILRHVDPADLATALKGVRDEVRNKVLSNMSSRAAENLAEEIAILGPVRVKTIEEAQGRIVRTIRQLEDSGDIVIKRESEDDFVD